MTKECLNKIEIDPYASQDDVSLEVRIRNAKAKAARINAQRDYDQIETISGDKDREEER